MTRGAGRPTSAWDDAAQAAALLAVDPAGAGGVVLRALPGPVRDRWLELLRDLLPPSSPWRRVPSHVSDDRLLGGLDLAATLESGRPVASRGILAEAQFLDLIADRDTQRITDFPDRYSFCHLANSKFVRIAHLLQ